MRIDPTSTRRHVRQFDTPRVTLTSESATLAEQNWHVGCRSIFSRRNH